jgi:hypothetical protein
MKASELDKNFDDGEEDVLQHFDLTKAKKPNLELKRVNVDFPVWVINGLDRRAKILGVTRQSLIKMWIAEKLN